MTVTLTIDRPTHDSDRPRRITRTLTAARRTLTTVARAVVSPHRAAARRLADIPLTVIAAGCLDYAAWHVNAGLGWLVTGASLLVIEQLISDDEQPDGRA